MTEQLPDPPYAADTRAKGWRFELDYERIRQSDTWAVAPPEVRPWLLMLWMVAWEQAPCGSMPAEPQIVAAKIGMSPKTFEKHRAILMRGWQKASDGRLYHAVLTERVRELLDYRDASTKRKADYRARMAAAEVGGSPAAVPGESRGSPAGRTVESRGKNATGTGTGTGTIKEKEKETSSPSAPRFDAFWNAYPRKVGKDAARKAFEKRKPDDVLLARMLRAIEAQSRGEAWRKDGGQFIPHPSTWLNEGRWQDEGVTFAAAAAPAPKQSAWLAEQAAHKAEVERQRLARKAQAA